MKKNIYVIASFIILASIIIAGCGKSDKEVKVGGKDEVKEPVSGTTVNVITNESKINWLGKKVTGQHNGTIDIANGELIVENGKIKGGKFDIDMNSITVEDLKDSEMNAKLTNHLKSDDFFSAEKHPISVFEITKAEAMNDPNKPEMNHNITGNLTIKGITKSITFPASVKNENGTVSAEADFDIDRTEWDVRYRSGKFFDNLGDKMINDNFNLKLKIFAK